MEPEDKELLFKDLSARLPYHVWCKVWLKDGTTEEGPLDLEHNYGNVLQDAFFYHEIKEIKPYLRPMSSMTEEEKKEYIEYAGYEIEESVNGRHYEYYLKDFCGTPDEPSVNTNGVDWLNKKMFDFRGLIPKDLALSTDEFNPYKE